MAKDSTFALCLTHDVDRISKGLHQALYYAVQERSLDHLRSVRAAEDPYWQLDELMALEDDLGVRSAVYFLNEPSLLSRELWTWLSATNWIEHIGRYDVTAPEIVDVIRRLDAGGWEVGLHGSRIAATDPERLAFEMHVLEAVLDGEIRGGRQHHLQIDQPETWRHYATLGLDYDASLGSGTEYGFRYGYAPIRPFDDEFVVFPLTLMEQALPDPGTAFDAAWVACAELLEEAAENDATMTVLWHSRYFNEDEFPGYRRLYCRLVERALEMDAWIGPPKVQYEQLERGTRNGVSEDEGCVIPSSASKPLSKE